MSARTTTVAVRPGRRRKRCGSTVISTPFGAIAVFPTVTERPRVETFVIRILRSRAERPATAPNDSSAGSAIELLLDGGAEIDQAGTRRCRVEVGTLGRSDEQAVERTGTERRSPLREHRCDAGCHRCGGARAADRPEPHLAVVATSRLGRRHGDARRREVGLERAVEDETARRERRDRPAGLATRHLDVADGHRHGNAGSEHRPDLGDDTLARGRRPARRRGRRG